MIDAALGRKEFALEEGKRATELMPVEKDSLNGQSMQIYFAIIAAWAGEKDLALEYLTLSGSTPGAATIANLGPAQAGSIVGPAPRRSALRAIRRHEGAEAAVTNCSGGCHQPQRFRLAAGEASAGDDTRRHTSRLMSHITRLPSRSPTAAGRRLVTGFVFTLSRSVDKLNNGVIGLFRLIVEH